MSNETTPMQRATDALARAGVQHAQLRDHYAERVIVAILDDPDLGPRLSLWRNYCEHSRLLNPREHAEGHPADHEQACSPCLRDRLTAYLLNGVTG